MLTNMNLQIEVLEAELRTIKAQIAQKQQELQQLQEPIESTSPEIIVPLQKTFNWSAKTTIQLPKILASERRDFQFSGQTTFEIRKSNYPGLGIIKIIDEKISLAPISLIVQNKIGFLPWFVRKKIRVPKLEIEKSNSFIYTKNEGLIHLKTGLFKFQSVIELTRKNIPLFNLLRINKLSVRVDEMGHMDLHSDNGKLSINGRFSVTSDAPQYFQLNASTPFFKGAICQTRTSLSASVNGTKGNRRENTFYICAGDKITLFWESSEDVTGTTITPDIGEVSPSGSITIKPEKTATYKIKARGEEQCKAFDEIKVIVVHSGDTVSMLAKYDDAASPWRLFISGACASKSIMIHQLIPGCDPYCYYVEDGSLTTRYTDCGQYNCLASWTVEKINLDGHLAVTDINDKLTILNDPLPLAGEWIFTPHLSIDAYPIPQRNQRHAAFTGIVKCVR